MEGKIALIPIDKALMIGAYLSDYGVSLLESKEYDELYNRVVCKWKHYNAYKHLVVKIVDEKKWLVTLLKLEY